MTREGGAASHDIQDGVLNPAFPDFEQEIGSSGGRGRCSGGKNVSWWPQELPSDEEHEEAVMNLERANQKADCILIRCAPTSIQQKLNRNYTPDRLTNFLQMMPI